MKRGFTLIELLIVIAITVVLASVVIINLGSRKLGTDLTVTTQQIATLLRQAQSDSMAQEGSGSWGVHFANPSTGTPFYALFSGSYATGSVMGQYRLPGTVVYRTSTLASGATLDIIFAQVSGAASASTSVGLLMPSAGLSSTISVASTGAVSY